MREKAAVSLRFKEILTNAEAAFEIRAAVEFDGRHGDLNAVPRRFPTSPVSIDKGYDLENRRGVCDLQEQIGAELDLDGSHRTEHREFAKAASPAPR